MKNAAQAPIYWGYRCNNRNVPVSYSRNSGQNTKNPGRAWLHRDNQMRKEGLEPSHPVWKQVPETCASTISPLSLLSCVTSRQRALFYTYDLCFATFFFVFFLIPVRPQTNFLKKISSSRVTNFFKCHHLVDVSHVIKEEKCTIPALHNGLNSDPHNV